MITSVLKKYLPNINKEQIEKADKLIEYLKSENLHYYKIEGPFIRERSEGHSVFFDVSVSIRISDKK